MLNPTFQGGTKRGEPCTDEGDLYQKKLKDQLWEVYVWNLDLQCYVFRGNVQAPVSSLKELEATLANGED